MEVPTKRDYFAFQYAFAEMMAKQKDLNIFEAVKEYSPMVAAYLFYWDRKKRTYGELSPRYNGDKHIVDFAYGTHLNTLSNEPTPYHQGNRYGCFGYDREPEEKVMHIHFSNAEDGPTGPLSQERMAERKKEIRDVLLAARREQPDLQEVHGNSWLYNLPAYRRLFPPSYTEHLVENRDPALWHQGSSIWGQFVDSEGGLKKDLADQFMEKLKANPDADPLEALPMKALRAKAPIKDFYDFYNITP